MFVAVAPTVAAPAAAADLSCWQWVADSQAPDSQWLAPRIPVVQQRSRWWQLAIDMPAAVAAAAVAGWAWQQSAANRLACYRPQLAEAPACAGSHADSWMEKAPEQTQAEPRAAPLAEPLAAPLAVPLARAAPALGAHRQSSEMKHPNCHRYQRQHVAAAAAATAAAAAVAATAAAVAATAAAAPAGVCVSPRGWSVRAASMRGSCPDSDCAPQRSDSANCRSCSPRSDSLASAPNPRRLGRIASRRVAPIERQLSLKITTETETKKLSTLKKKTNQLDNIVNYL